MILKHQVCDKLFNLGKLRITFLHFLTSILLDGTNQRLHGELLVIQLFCSSCFDHLELLIFIDEGKGHKNMMVVMKKVVAIGRRGR